MTDKPDKIAVEIGGESLKRLAELLPAVAHQAEQAGVPPPSPADVVELALTYFHTAVFSRASDILADDIGDEIRDQAQAQTERKRSKNIH